MNTSNEEELKAFDLGVKHGAAGKTGCNPHPFGDNHEAYKDGFITGNVEHKFTLPTDKWVSVEDVLKVINDPKWSWVRSINYKYISLRIDTRDDHCLIFDRHNNEITLEQLKQQ